MSLLLDKRRNILVLGVSLRATAPDKAKTGSRRKVKQVFEEWAEKGQHILKGTKQAKNEELVALGGHGGGHVLELDMKTDLHGLSGII